MNDRLRHAMAQATRLTREGRLLEATALIKRTIGQTTQGDDDDVVPADHPVVGGPPVLAAIERPSGAVPASRPSIPNDTDMPTHGSSGRFINGLCASSAGTRDYKLYIPGTYHGQPLPLLVMLHGCTQDAADLARGTRMNEHGEAGGFFVLYPEQSRKANGQRCWNWFKPAHQGRDGGEPAIIAAITREVMTTYAVDPHRVWIAGISAGGAMAALVGDTYPDLYRAVGIHSGIPPRVAHNLRSAYAVMQRGDTATAAPSLPTIVFHGTADATVNPANADGVLGQSDATKVIATEGGQVPGGRRYIRTLYRTVTGDVPVEKWLVEGAGHAWSGGSAEGSFTDPRGPDASTEMARFFRDHTGGAGNDE